MKSPLWLLSVLFLCSCNDSSNQARQNHTPSVQTPSPTPSRTPAITPLPTAVATTIPASPAPNPVSYQIVKRDDISVKALDNLLSSYSHDELTRLPIAKRVRIRAVLPTTIKQIEMIPTIDAIMREVQNGDPDMDVIALFLFTNPKAINGPAELGTATWGPEGKPKVPSQIARSNNRSNYKTEYEIRPDVEAYLASQKSTEVKFGLSVEKRRELFFAVVKAEDEARKMADSEIKGTDLDTMMKNKDLFDKYNNAAKEKILKKWGITSEQENEITVEAFNKGWLQETY